ncbi:MULTISPECIES: hypothetical protein [unclassified Actinobaculum]|nr:MULTISPECIES: hypothetical protein [unclassified Actinobaculum]
MGKRKRETSGEEKARILRAVLRIAQLQAFNLAIAIVALLIALLR